jgi:hemerythrin-like domain-containing protein
MEQAIRVLKDEHRSIAAVLQGMQQLARKAKEPGVRPGFDVFRAMLRYIDEFPERLHHPKEDLHLFARLLERAPEADQLVVELRAEHVVGARLVRSLEQALNAFEAAWPDGAQRFAEAVDAYADFHWQHMRKEEHELLPLAERKLKPEDWRAIGEAFAGNRDPIADLREQDFEKLYTRIVSLAPAPVGLGASWNKRGA